MGFHNDPFPEDISYGSEGGGGWNTTVVELESGSEEAIAHWSTDKNRFDVAYNVKTRAQLSAVLKHFKARGGAANRFPFKDWSDYASTSDGGTTSFSGAGGGAAPITNVDQTLGTGNAVLTQFQLVKRYVSGPTTYTKNITRPVAGSLLISFDTGGGPVNQTSGFSLDSSTGIVTFTSAPANGTLIKCGYLFYIPCRYDESIDKTGIRWRFTDGDQVDCQTIPIVEVPEGPAIDEDAYTGGSASLGVIAASFSVNMGLGHFQVWTVNTASLSATMPIESNIPDGWPIFGAKNDGTQSIQVKRSDGTNEFSIASGATATFALVTQSGVKRWYGL